MDMERQFRYRNDYFSELIEGYAGTEEEALRRGAQYGLASDKHALLIAARQDARPSSGKSLVTEGLTDYQAGIERDRHYGLLEQAFARTGYDCVMFVKHGGFGILLYCEESALNEGALLAQLKDISEMLYREQRLSYSFGVGNPFTGALNVGASYREALHALQDGDRMGKKRFALLYRSMDVGRLFRLLPHEEAERYYREALKELLGTGEQEHGEMLRTLKAYYENHCNLIETAKALHVHRNTVVYRVEKAEKLLGRKLKDARTAFGFRVAFAMEEMLGSENLAMRNE
jgi:purine catabolism regulator